MQTTVNSNLPNNHILCLEEVLSSSAESVKRKIMDTMASHSNSSLSPFDPVDSKYPSKKIQALAQMERCLNCGIGIHKQQRNYLSPKDEEIVAQWTGQQLPLQGKICFKCAGLVQECDLGAQRMLGHKLVCMGCGTSVVKKRFSVYRDEDTLALYYPWYKLYKDRFLCRPCKTSLDRTIEKEQTSKLKLKLQIPKDEECKSKEEKSEQQLIKLEVSKAGGPTIEKQHMKLENSKLAETAIKEQHMELENSKLAGALKENRIIMPSFRRVIFSRYICIHPNCQVKGELLSKWKRKLVFKQRDLYLSSRARVCQRHLTVNDWSFLEKYKSSNQFSVPNVEDMLSLVQNPTSLIDFDRINEMPEHICKYWTGLGVEDFKILYDKLVFDKNIFNSLRNALAIFLSRKITGDSVIRLANLFSLPLPKLTKQLAVVEKCLEKINYLS